MRKIYLILIDKSTETDSIFVVLPAQRKLLNYQTLTIPILAGLWQ